jgi:hypothetical protein
MLQYNYDKCGLGVHARHTVNQDRWVERGSENTNCRDQKEELRVTETKRHMMAIVVR